MKLTEREKWLMSNAYEDGWQECAENYSSSFGEYLKENEARLAAEAPTVDCKQCANKGRINGTSQELVCDSCIHYGSSWRKDMFVPTGEDR